MSELIEGSQKRDDTLKFIAITTMFIDHIGYLLYPEYFILRVIGRLSFPIFAYLLVKGAQRTSKPLAYLFRLALFAFVSQIPYNLFTHHPMTSFTAPNIFFTLLAGLCMLLTIKQESIAIKPFALIFLLIAEPLHLSYSYYGLLLMLVFYWFDTKPLQLVIGTILVSLQYYLQFDNPNQFYALAALPLLIHNPRLNIRLNKWVAYLFYPLHLLLLFAIYFFWF